jgi:hypothetical protein
MSDFSRNDRLSRGLEALATALAFALAYTQAPLFFSNQNQYLLHGFSEAGVGHLNRDWLAQTRDPTPVFTELVDVSVRNLGAACLQVEYFLLLMAYFLSVRWLVGALPGALDTRAFRLAFAAVFTAAHAAIPRIASVQLCGVDYPWFLQAGVAGQYLLGPGLQPSALGFQLMTSLAAFANGRPTLAAFLAALACAFHSTYLLPASLLILGYLVERFRGNPDFGARGLWMVLSASVVMAPVCAFILFRFGPTNPELFARSQQILAETRIPHHCVIARWFDEVAALQLLWIVAGLILLRRSPLALALVVAAAGGLMLSLVQYATGSPSLALAFPWRITTVLVPAATAVIGARLAAQAPNKPWVAWGAGIFLACLAGAGIWVMVDRLGYRSGDEEQPLYEYVRTHADASDVYLLPVRIPAVGNGRGSVSTSFTPPPRPKPGSNLIPVDLQRFRLSTGTPIYVDFKSVPYADFEVLMWLNRVRQCEAWYESDWTGAIKADELKREKITHVVVPASRPIQAPYLAEVHSDAAYIVYRLK